MGSDVSCSLDVGSDVTRGDGVEESNVSLEGKLVSDGEGVGVDVRGRGSGVGDTSLRVSVVGVRGRGVSDGDGDSNRVVVGRLVNRGVSAVDSDIVVDGVGRGSDRKGVEGVGVSSEGGVDGVGVGDSTSEVCEVENEREVVGVGADSAVGVCGVDSTLVGSDVGTSESLDGSASDEGESSEGVAEPEVSNL